MRLSWENKQDWLLRLFSLAFVAAVTVAMAPASARHPSSSRAASAAIDLDRLYSVDLRDLAQYRSKGFPEARALVHAMTKYPRSFFPAGVTFDVRGVGVPAAVNCAANSGKRGKPLHLANSVYGIEISEPPLLRGDGLLEVPLVALLHSKDVSAANGYIFRKMRAWIDESELKVTNVVIERDIPLSETRFELRVGLVDRKAILIDSVHGIRKVYPIGVGAFDEGTIVKDKNVLLTPTFKNARLKEEWAQFERDDKDYYCGMPFLRIQRQSSTRAGGWTPYGFHISQHRDLLRGFDSHGCMRLREKDLYELYFILKNHGDSGIPLNIALESTSPGDHPYPLTNRRYQKVVDCKNPTKPARGCAAQYAAWERRHGARALPAESCRGDDELTQTRSFKCAPPIASLHGYDGDDASMSFLPLSGGMEF